MKKEYKINIRKGKGRPPKNPMVDAPRIYSYFRTPNDKCDKNLILERNESTSYDKFIIRDETTYKYLVFDNIDQFIQWFPKANKTLHEVIIGERKQKIKFDIDIPLNREFEDLDIRVQNIHNAVMNAIKAAFFLIYVDDLKNDEIIVCDSTDKTKFSRHYIIHGMCVNNNLEAKYFTEVMIKNLPAAFPRKHIDDGVNKSLQNFRLPECHKTGSNRIKRIISNHTFIDALISYNDNCHVLQEQYIQPKARQIAEVAIDNELENRVVNASKQYTEGCSYNRYDSGYYMYRRNAPGFCQICERTHDRDNTPFVTISKSGDLLFHCRKESGKTICIEKNFVQQPVEQVVNVIPEIKSLIKRVDNIKTFATKYPSNFNVNNFNSNQCCNISFGDNYDTLLVSSLMGTGKSQALREYIAKLDASWRIIIISFRKSFTSEICSKLPEFTDYRKVKGQLKQNRIIVQLESLHRVEIMPNKRTLLIMDEVESILNQFENPVMKHKGTFDDTWAKFEHLFTYSEHVIAMDAFPSTRTFELLGNRDSVTILHNDYIPAAEVSPQDFIYETEEQMLESLYVAAEDAKNEPFVFVSSSIKVAKVVAEKCAKLNPDAKIKFYCSETSEKDREELEDVNTNWSDIDILIYTSTISAGCSFERQRFTKMFAYFSSRSVDYRTAIQMMGRIRSLSTRQYHIFIKSARSDIPDSKAEIEKMLRFANGAGCLSGTNIETDVHRCVKFINAIGEVDFKLKDLYYHTHVNNLVAKCESRNKFFYRFIQLRKKMGAIVSAVEYREEYKEIMKEIRDEKTVEMNAIEIRECNDIAIAPVVSDEELQRLQNAEFLEKVDRDKLTAHELCAYYNIEKEKLTADFVKKYDKQKMKKIYFNLNRICFDKDINTSATAIIERNRCQNAYNNEINAKPDQKRNISLCKSLFALDIINIIFEGYGRDMSHFDKRYIASVLVTDKVDEVINYLEPHLNTIASMFEFKKERLNDMKGREFKQKLEFINSILNSEFNLKITLNREDRSMYFLKPQSAFVYFLPEKKWIVNI